MINVKMMKTTVFALLSCTVLSSPVLAQEKTAPKMSKAALSDKPKAMLSEDAIGPRGAPLIEFGDPFLSTGRLNDPLVLPTGAVWNPSLWIYGNYRAAVQGVDHENREGHVEVVNRLDVTANLQLSGTERIVVGVTPLHEGGDFSRYVMDGTAAEEGGHSSFGAHLSTAFAEFELAELFPNFDLTDELPLDIGFAVGRQKIEFQDGFLVNDMIDSVGVVKNNLMIPGIINTRITGLFGWNEVNRSNNVRDEDAKLYGLFTSYDLANTSIDVDAIYINSEDKASNNNFGDSLHIAVSAAQRIGLWNTEARLLASQGLDTDSAAANDGVLAYLETSTSFPGAPHIFYANGFAGAGDFTSASRTGTAGGPLGRTGLLFSSASLGAYGAPLDNRGQDTVGGAVGYQMFFGLKKRLTLEAGGVADTGGSENGGYGVAAKYSQKLSRHFILNMGSYLAENEDAKGTGFGLRSEIEIKF